MHSLTFIFLAWVIGFGACAFLVRERLCQALLNKNVPLLVGYYSLVLPIILIEESLTIEVPYFWGILPMVITFSIYFFLLYLVQRTTKVSSWQIIILCGSLGWVNEFLLVGHIHQMNGLVLGIMSILCWLIYAVMEILPSYYVQKYLKEQAS